MKKYRTGGYSKNLIQEVEIVRETEKQVVIRSHNGSERREAKRSDYQNYFDDWQSAKDFLLNNAEKKVDGIKMQLERARGELGNIKGLRQEL